MHGKQLVCLSQGPQSAVAYWLSVAAVSRSNGLTAAFEREQTKQRAASHRWNVALSTGGVDTILALHPDHVYPDAVEYPEADRPASRIVSRLKPECAKYPGATDADIGCAVRIRQFAKLAGIQANGTDYVKPVTARGFGEPSTVVKGPMMDVRFLAHWRDGFNPEKAAAARVRLEDKAMRFHFPYMLDSDGRWRKPRTLKDGRIVYGRDKVSSSVLLERWRDAELTRECQVDADARRVREIELAELMRLQAQDMIAQGRGKVAKADRTEPTTALGQAMQAAGIG